MQTILMKYLSRLLNLQKNKFQVDSVEFATDKHTSLKCHSTNEICMHWNFYLFISASEKNMQTTQTDTFYYKWKFC